MVRHIIIAAWRNMAANKLISAIAILGLAVGIAAALLMAAVIRNQLSFDHFIPGRERTYIAVTRDNPRHVKLAPCPAVPLCQRGAPTLAAKLKLAAPEIEAITRLAYTEGANGDEPLTLQSGAVTGQEMLYWADPNAFDVLPLPVLQGNLATALAHPDGIVLPRAMARKYFGRDDVVGRSIALEGHPMIVRAVIWDLPANGTTLMSGIFAAGSAAFSPLAPSRPRGPPVYTYLRLKPGASVAAVQDRITAVVDATVRARGPIANEPHNLSLGKIAAPGPGQPGRIQQSRNYQTPAGSLTCGPDSAAHRVGELRQPDDGAERAARKGCGYSEGLWRQPCGADRAISGRGDAGSAAGHHPGAGGRRMADAGGHLINACTFLRTGARLNDPLLPLLLAGALASGLAAGAWPAFVLSAFRPASTLRGWSAGEGAGLIRNLLVALQFTMLITLAIATTVVWQQRNYAMREALQVDSDNVLLVRTDPPSAPVEQWPKDMRSPDACPVAFRDAVRRLPGVRDIRCTGQSFLAHSMSINWFAKSGVLQTMGANQVDLGVFTLYGVKPLAGTLADTNGSILNLSAVKLLGFASPQAAIGQDWLGRLQLPRGELDGYRARIAAHSRVTAVVPDFAFTSVTKAALPAMYSAWQESVPARAIHIKLSGNDVPEALGAIDRAWSETGQPGPIDRVFVRDYVAQFYQDMLREAQFFSAFAVIAILLTCVGLAGIAVSTAERRTKEIGVRKAMGANNRQIVALLLWQFSQPVLWANVIAWPAAWWLMRRWLSGFAYHIDLHWWVFAGASLYRGVADCARHCGGTSLSHRPSKASTGTEVRIKSRESAPAGTLAVPFVKNEEAAFRRSSHIYLISFEKPGAGERIRTVDPNLGKCIGGRPKTSIES